MGHDPLLSSDTWIEYIAGFMWFILTLKKKMYKYQFGQYAWTHMILIVVFTQSSFTVANIFEGIFWYICELEILCFSVYLLKSHSFPLFITKYDERLCLKYLDHLASSLAHSSPSVFLCLLLLFFVEMRSS